MGRKLRPGIDKIDEDWVKKEVKAILDPFKPSLKWDMPGATMYGASGRHDFIICQQGLFWTIETKAGKNKPTDNQIDYANDVAKAGGISILVNEWNLEAVAYVAEFVRANGSLPPGHDFEEYRKP
jgi:hypothetical protein